MVRQVKHVFPSHVDAIFVDDCGLQRRVYLLVLVSKKESFDCVSYSCWLNFLSEVLIDEPSGSRANGAGALRFIFSCCVSWLYDSTSSSTGTGMFEPISRGALPTDYYYQKQWFM